MKIRKLIIIALAVLCAALALCSCSGDEETLTEATYYTVRFDSTGGSAIDPMTVVSGSTIQAPPEPVRDGYIFDGWVDNTGDSWSFGVHNVKGDMTLFARWIEASSVFEYRTVDGEEGVIISKLKSVYSEDIKVPTVINGLRVIGIGEGVFADSKPDAIKKITLPESVSIVKGTAFANCVGIEIAVMGELTEVGEKAFLNCDGLSSVRLGEGLAEISVQAFCGCVSLKEIRLPDSLEKIGENAFEDCVSLVYAVMHDGVALSNSAFIGCDALVTVYFYGTEESFEGMFALDNDRYGNEGITEARLYFYSAQKPEADGDFWYMDEKGKIKLWK